MTEKNYPTYTGGTHGPFPFYFPCNNADDIECVIATGHGDMVLAKYQYTVRLNENQFDNAGGEVSLNYILPHGNYITIGEKGKTETPANITNAKGEWSNLIDDSLRRINDRIDNTIKILQEDFSKTKTAYTEIFNNSELFNSRLADANSKLDALNENIQQIINTTMDKITNQLIVDLKIKVTADIREELSNIQKSLDGKITANSNSVKTINEKISEANSKIKSLENADTDFNSQLESLSTNLNSLQSNYETLQTNYENLQKEITDLKSKENENSGGTE